MPSYRVINNGCGNIRDNVSFVGNGVPTASYGHNVAKNITILDCYVDDDFDGFEVEGPLMNEDADVEDNDCNEENDVVDKKEIKVERSADESDEEDLFDI
ncbi:unnamed protein product [Dovyalis caffra]|uniref:Uncharacterized protein n=1 Tax=Dovyalis caffra TaxID=77055 RepID=A0AAV1RE42_9ROSI|nr:unnamed protein product [Dovyalis caffra]